MHALAHARPAQARQLVSENKHWWDETRERKDKLCQATLLQHQHSLLVVLNHKVSFELTMGHSVCI